MLAVVPSFESRRACEAIVHAARLAPPVRDTPTLREFAAEQLVRPTVNRIHDAVAQTLDGARCNIDYAAVTEMRVGGSHPPHADAVRRAPGGGWEPNHTPHRIRTALLYLNSNPEDFTGGEIVFRRTGVTIVPRTGTLVIAPTTGCYEHEVLEVTRGVRWLLAVWFRAHRA